MRRVSREMEGDGKGRYMGDVGRNTGKGEECRESRGRGEGRGEGVILICNVGMCVFHYFLPIW